MLSKKAILQLRKAAIKIVPIRNVLGKKISEVRVDHLQQETAEAVTVC